jgi:hypothetical protein
VTTPSRPRDAQQSDVHLRASAFISGAPWSTPEHVEDHDWIYDLDGMAVIA